MSMNLFWLRKRSLMVTSLFLLCLSGALAVSPIAAQSSYSTSNFGVGQGNGLEVGINLPVLEQVQADIAAGVYDRPCTEAEHDPTKWHSLVNVEAKCHYDHQHNDDPHYVDDIFGEPGAWFGSPGQSISYPWQTFPAQTTTESNAAYLGTGKMENEAKHEGYYWVVRRDQPCNSPDGQFCVKDFRVQFHGMMNAHGAATRFHSFSAELRACQNVNDVSTCGIVRTGGWLDYGRLFTMDPQADPFGRAMCGTNAGEALVQIPLPVDHQYFPFQTNSNPLDEERCHPLLTPEMIAAGPRTGNVGDGPKAEWWAHGGSDFRLQLQVANPIGNVYETSPGSGELVENTFCNYTDPSCDWNQSIITMRIQYTLGVNSYYVDGYSDGNITSLGLDAGRFITRFGAINPSCTAPGLDCIPIEYNHLRLNGVPARFSHTPCLQCEKIDYDLSPAGQQWITWFYGKYGTVMPTDPPPQPEEPAGPAVFFQVDDSNSESVSVNVKLINVTNVYGIQTECQVNPQVLQGNGLVEGDAFNQSNSFVIDEGFQADGLWRVAATRLKPNPAVDGTALAFTLNYDVVATGDGQLQCSALAVDENGVNVALDVVNGTVMIMPPAEPSGGGVVEGPPVPAAIGAITGQVVYQNRPDNAGIVAKLVGINDATLDEVTTGPDGAYSFADLPDGEYTVELLAPQHIPAVENITIDSTNASVQLNDLLHAGDIDDNGVIDMADVTLVGANFGTSVVPEISHVDLNGDGWINISDLTLVGGNLDLVSPLLTP